MLKVKCPIPSCEFDTDNPDDSIVAALVTTHAMVHNTPPEANNTIKVEKVTQPTISAGSTNKDWTYFECRWKDYVEATKVTGKELITQLLECCDETLRSNLTRSAGGSLIDESPDDVLKAIRILAVREKNPMVARNKLNNMSQGIEETVRSFGVRLQEQSDVCNFTIQCACCDVDVDYTDAILHDVLIRGLNDPDTQLDLLDDQNQNMSLEEVFLFVEAKEARKRSPLNLLETQGAEAGKRSYQRNEKGALTMSTYDDKYEMDTEQTAETSVQIKNESDNTEEELPQSSNIVETDMAISAEGKHSTSISIGTQGVELASSKYELDTEQTSETSVQDHNVSDKEKEIIQSPITVQTETCMYASAKAKSHVCNVCENSFACKSMLTRHMTKHTGVRPHVCKVCHKTFRMKYDLTLHMKIHTGDKPHVCNICDKAFRVKGELKTHMTVHTGEKPHACNICGKAFRLASYRNEHMAIHTGKKEHVCIFCSKAFSTSGHLTRHVSVHTGEKRHVCNVCDKAFADRSALCVHKKIHTGEKPYLCNICGKGFRASGQLSRHISVHADETALLTHMTIVTKEKKHLCTVCGKAFSFEYEVKRHMPTHTGEKKHLCTICGKAFGSQAILYGHMKTHGGEKTHACNVCGKAFRYANALATHMTDHTGKKTHVCSVCDKGFNFASALAKHMPIHTGEKRHVCNVCGKAFGNSGTLYGHLKIHKS